MSDPSIDHATVEPRRVHNGGWSTDATDPEMVRALARRVIRPVRERARELGWAIGMHGSMERDIDLIAVPWTERAVAPETLANSLRQVLDKLYGVGLEVGPNEAHPKPHGRLCWSFWIRPWTYIDLSIWGPDPRINALGEERDHWKRIAQDRLESANEQLYRARDAERERGQLREVVRRYGDRARMATVETPGLQEVIDAALNPDGAPKSLTLNLTPEDMADLDALRRPSVPTMISALRVDEGDSITLLCDNPEGPPNNAVECCGEWTGWQARRFEGDTLDAAIQAAFDARAAVRPGDGHAG